MVVPMNLIQNEGKSRTIYVGAFVHSRSLQDLEICESGTIGVDEKGVIAFVERGTDDIETIARNHGWQTGFEIIKLKGNGFYFPGFIDTHIHASQYPNSGIFGKSTLLDWLNTYTFPLESSFSDLAKAQKIYNQVVHRTLSHGTTTAAYYATIHVPATNLLADICMDRGQRAFVGRVCMNELSPDWYRDESAEQSVQATRETIDHMKSIDAEHALITPIITPRFAPSCSKDCLAGLGALHKETGYPCQTHISENKKEIELVAELFPDAGSYAAVYDEAGLLTDKMVLAHAIHLSPSERALVKARKSKVSHCPASNTALTSGCCPVRELLDDGIDVGLGTDVSGGFSPSILEAVRHAIWVSRHKAMTSGDEAKLTVEEALYLGTRGGAKVMNLENRIGGFEVGMDWDAQMVLLDDVSGELDEAGPVDVFGWEKWEDKVHKWVFNGDDRNTVAVWVKGRLVHNTKRYVPG